MVNFILNARERTAVGNLVKKLRSANQIPATLYGRGLTSANLTLDYVPFEKLYHRAGESSLVDLNLEGVSPTKVLIQDIQFHPLTGRITHVDLRQVKMDEKIKTDIKLNFVGEAPAIKELGGIFVKSFSLVPVECLAGDLVGEINVDISSLKEFGDVIHVKDIVPPPGVKILAHEADVIATVIPPRSEEELKAEAAAPAADISAVKVETEEKKQEREAAAAAAAEGGKGEPAPKKKG